MILGVDTGLASFGWAKLSEHTAVPSDGIEDLGVLMQPADKSLSPTVDRTLRARRQVQLLDSMAHNVTAIVREKPSYNPRLFDHNVCITASAEAIAAWAWCMGIPLYEIAPKDWQHAVTGHGGKVDQDEIARRATVFIAHSERASRSLQSIGADDRWHAFDATCIAACFIRRPQLATRIE